jgi:hypothetical protein
MTDLNDSDRYEEISNLRNLFEGLADLLFEKEDILRSNSRFLVRVSSSPETTDGGPLLHNYKISKIGIRQGRLWDFICHTPNFLDAKVLHQSVIIIAYENGMWSESPKVGDWVLVQARTFASSLDGKTTSVFKRFVDSLDL